MLSTSTEILIAGAGPTGLAAALVLANKGIACRIIDKRVAPAQESRAQVMNPRALELLEPVGVAQKVLAESHSVHRTLFYKSWDRVAEIEFGHAHPRFPLSVLPQARSEALLTEALGEHGIRPERGVALESFSQDGSGVMVTLLHADEQREVARTRILLGADGAHSRVRDTLGIAFEGSSFPEDWPLYDIELNDPLDLESAHVRFAPSGMVLLLGIRP